jgi:hypothetical protein
MTSSQDQSRFDLRNLARQQLIETIESIRGQYKDAKFVMVIDTESLPVLGAIFRTIELVEKHIVLLEKYELKRKPLPSYHGLYFLNPSTSLAKVIEDFSGDAPRYAAAHILFTYPCGDAPLDELRGAPAVVARIVTLKCLFLQFTPHDAFTFWVPASEALVSLYARSPTVPWVRSVDKIVSGLISFFFSIKAQPVLAFEKANDKVVALASQFQRQIEATFSTLGPAGGSIAKNNTILLILSRGADPVAPLLHQFTYEAFVREALSQSEEYQIDERDPSSLTVLNYYEDDLFRRLRFVDYPKLQDIIEPENRPFAELQRLTREGETVEIRSDATKRLARENKKRCEAGNHYCILGKLSDEISRRPLVTLAEYEQSLATGMESGEKFKPNTPRLTQVVTQSNLAPGDAARVLALYQIRGKKLDSDLERLCTTAGVEPKHTAAIANIADCLGPAVPRKTEAMLVKEAFKTDKYIPLVNELVGNIVDGKLDPKLFEGPQGKTKYQNIVVFVVGGISFMELRWLDAARARLKGTKLYVGSTTYLLPRSFLAQLANLRT